MNISEFQKMLDAGAVQGWGLPERIVVENQLREYGTPEELGAFQKMTAFIKSEEILSPQNVASFSRVLGHASLHFGTKTTAPSPAVPRRSPRSISAGEVQAAVAKCFPGANVARFIQSNSGQNCFALAEVGSGRRLVKIPLTTSSEFQNSPAILDRSKAALGDTGAPPTGRQNAPSSSEFSNPEVEAAYARAVQSGRVKLTSRQTKAAARSDFQSDETFAAYQKAVRAGHIKE